MFTVVFSVSILLLIIDTVMISANKFKILGRVITNIGILAASVAGWVIGSFVILFLSKNGELYFYVFSAFLLAVFVMFTAIIWNRFVKKIYIPVFSVIGICILTAVCLGIYQHYDAGIPKIEEKDVLLEYAPYYSKTKVVEPETPVTLKIDKDIPKMDGATALYPIYSAFAKAVYPKYLLEDIVSETNEPYRRGNEFLECSTTTEAYHKIVTGDADIIFVAGPSDEQKQFAAENNVELIYTPIGKEAFVFFVNAKNPVDGMTSEQIRRIYSGKITKWSELGVKGMGKIKAFQRDQGSGSQTMLERFMKSENLMEPPSEPADDGMFGIINKTADYKNYKNAIGYSFRFYATEMVKNSQIKLLKVDGVEPNKENIENVTYPLVSEFYAVTRTDASENTKKLLDWICSEQGIEIIEKTGYTPINRK